MKKIIAMAVLCLAFTSVKAQYINVSVRNLNPCSAPPSRDINVNIILNHIPSCTQLTVIGGVVPYPGTRPFSLAAGPLNAYNNVDYEIIGVEVTGGTPAIVGTISAACGATLLGNNAPGGPCATGNANWDITSPVPSAFVTYQ